jgi:Domain of unknown function (DUF4351)
MTLQHLENLLDLVPLNQLSSRLVSALRFLAHNGRRKMLAEFSSSDVLISIALLLNNLYYSHHWDAPSYIDSSILDRIQVLSTEELEILGEEFLGFADVSTLIDWLD